MRKILVLRGGALGDFVVTLPALALLRERWPESRIELVGNATAAEFACTRKLVNAVHSQHEARWSVLFDRGSLPPPFAAWLAEFDLVLNYWPDPDGELRSHFPSRPEQIFLAAPAMPARAPAAAHYCEPLRELGLETTRYWCRIEADRIVLGPKTAKPASLPAGARADDVRRPIAIHPGSGSSRKNWPAERWLELIPHLASPVLLILGEAETDTWNSLLPLCRGVDALINPSLETLIGQLAHCRLFLGHDSGVSHLAAGCGSPCVLLFGPTDPAIWAPPAPNVQVVRRGDQLVSLSVDDVLQAAASMFGDRT